MEKGSSCKSCGKYPFCEKQGQVCEEWRKQPYTVLEEVKEGKIFKFRRVD